MEIFSEKKVRVQKNRLNFVEEAKALKVSPDWSEIEFSEDETERVILSLQSVGNYDNFFVKSKHNC